jgi:hypothetical protein
MSDASMTARRENRSTTVPPTRSRTTHGASLAATTSARSTGLCVIRSTSSGNATMNMPLPAMEMVCPLHSSAKLRFRSGASPVTGWLAAGVADMITRSISDSAGPAQLAGNRGEGTAR